jgi:GNAT superfamily N-acetyltransferase
VTSLSADLSIAAASDADAATIASLRTAVAEDLTRAYGRGHWSSAVTEQSVRRGLRISTVVVARHGAGIIAVLRLATKKPWAIDPSYFTSARRPLYLSDMAVDPQQQRRGVGRRLLEEAKAIAVRLGSDAIRLDAYDAAAGAGPFYAKCGFREVGRVTYRRTSLVYFELIL